MRVIDRFILTIKKPCSIALLCIISLTNGYADVAVAQELIKADNASVNIQTDIGVVQISPDIQRKLSDQTMAILSDTVAEVASVMRERYPQFTDALTITISATQQNLDHVGGVIGVAQSPDEVNIEMATSFSGGLEALIRQGLKVTLLHELHHIERGWTIENNRFGPGIMTAAVNEGLAIVFAEQESGVKQSHLTYPDAVDNWVEEILALPVNAPYETWMMGTHPDGRPYIGYRTGKFIIEEAMRNGHDTIESLTNKGAYEILSHTGLIDTNASALRQLGDEFVASNQPKKAITTYRKAMLYAEQPMLQTKLEQRIALLTDPITLSGREMREIAGQYHAQRMDIRVVPDKSGLLIQLPGKPELRLYATSNSTFILLEADVSFEFLLNEDDAVTALLFSTPGGVLRLDRVTPP